MKDTETLSSSLACFWLFSSFLESICESAVMGYSSGQSFPMGVHKAQYFGDWATKDWAVGDWASEDWVAGSVAGWAGVGTCFT